MQSKIYKVTFKGKQVDMQSFNRAEDNFPNPAICHHEIMVMHHTDDKSKHFCPTGFIYCPLCWIIGDEVEPYECTRWNI